MQCLSRIAKRSLSPPVASRSLSHIATGFQSLHLLHWHWRSLRCIGTAAHSLCLLLGWPEQRFTAGTDYDTCHVDTRSGTFDLMLSTKAVTNLRTNISDRNLWDKALLYRAMGPREWLPVTVVRDVHLHSGHMGVVPDGDNTPPLAQQSPDVYIDPFDEIALEEEAYMQHAAVSSGSDSVSNYLLSELQHREPLRTDLIGVKWIYKPAGAATRHRCQLRST